MSTLQWKEIRTVMNNEIKRERKSCDLYKEHTLVKGLKRTTENFS